MFIPWPDIEVWYFTFEWHVKTVSKQNVLSHGNFRVFRAISKIQLVSSVDEKLDLRSNIFIGDAETLPSQKFIKVKFEFSGLNQISKVENCTAVITIVIKVETEDLLNFEQTLVVHIFKISSKAECESGGPISFPLQWQSYILVVITALWSYI